MNKKIIVVDDDPSIVDAIKIMLEMSGYSVVRVEDGSKVLTVAKKEYPDLILLDIWMSGIDGKKICKLLKTDNKTKEIPIIIISASRDIKNASKEAYADDFIEKPFEMNYLLEKVGKYIGN